MMQTKLFKQFFGLATLMVLLACGKQSSGGGGGSTPIPPAALLLNETWLDNTLSSASNVQISRTVQIKLRFSAAIDRSTVANGISLTDQSGVLVNTNIAYDSKDSVVLISPVAALKGLSLYSLKMGNGLQSTIKTSLASDIYTTFNTAIDPSNKFPLLTDEEFMEHFRTG
jgi:hypothetical protein